MSSADFTIYTPGIGTLLYGVISSVENSAHFSASRHLIVYLIIYCFLSFLSERFLIL